MLKEMWRKIYRPENSEEISTDLFVPCDYSKFTVPLIKQAVTYNENEINKLKKIVDTETENKTDYSCK